MEEFVDAVTGGAVWGVGFGVALGAVGALGGGLRPVAKRVVRGAVAAGDWVQSATAEGRESLQDLYHEARNDLETRGPTAAGGAKAGA